MGKFDTAPTSPIALRETLQPTGGKRFVRESPKLTIARNQDIAVSIRLDKKTVDLPPLK